jgi:hypothetical protein
MTFDRQLPPPRRKPEGVDRQEQQTWARFYPQARCDATLAEEILNELERDDVLRRRHRGLYLSCQRCVRLHALRQARNQHVGQLVRAVVGWIAITAPQAVYRGLRQAGQLLLACLPQQEEQEPDTRWEAQTARLLERDAYAQGGHTVRIRARKAAEKASGSASESADKAAPRSDASAAGASPVRAAPAVAKSAVG